MYIEIKEFSDTHKLCVVTTKRGYSYACTWALEKNQDGTIISPTVEQVKEAWKTDRTSFEKYNGVYLFQV
ncbi:hypothetical protein IMZ31_24220 (plasmid) [Pontibacillus sp. ALD_SL1]|uniref:hypothetical protein n=1 Tax=Pontibacillus sp. ALD_SL1 TaxID=2777185 RepID=UPI001A96398A|nr:hypothetical protein [Pontibacillus sp. ALD_SL1]QST02559.1 hypothetical protein IMZ31_24220 [Pontibacillus sp. ALD_SL1]